jgi:hypothetical protein
VAKPVAAAIPAIALRLHPTTPVARVAELYLFGVAARVVRMKANEFHLTSARLIVTDPGYDLETAEMDGLGVIVSPCLPGM